MVEETPEIDPEAELWGVEEDEKSSVSIDEFADLDDDGDLS
ncbi:MAG: hypothetical protein ACRDNE_05255 [Gaiellaceae bacterium]